jgi:ketosteroid isomerase-like protein
MEHEMLPCTRGWTRLWTGRVCRVVVSALLCAAVLLGSASFAGAQQKDKKNKNKKDTPADSTNPTSIMSDEQQLDYVISTMLGAWQVDDLEKLHSTYAEDVVIVSGNWAPPIIGWSNFSTMYQQQRSHMQQVRMDRSNTVIKVAETFGWACYQWEFASVIDGQQSVAQGQTTLVFEKQNGRWLIAHNHTSLVQAAGALTPVKPASAPPPSQPPRS